MTRVTTPRDKTLIQTSWISTIGNAILSIAKIVVGVLSGSLAVVGDGIDSAMDVIISLVMLFTARIMNRPPNSKYVYGYEKAEGIATKILSLLIFYAGLQMLISTATSIFSSQPKELPGQWAVSVTLLSIVGKLGLALYQHKQGKKVKSSMLIANAVNMRNDVVISSGVLLGLLFTFMFNVPILDSITGFIVSVFIIKSSITIFFESNVELMDGVKDVSVYDDIFNAVEKVAGAHNAHRVRSRQIGSYYMISLDIEVDGKLSLNEAHTIAVAVEDSIKELIENVYDIVVHVEPKGEDQSGERFGVAKEMIR